MIYHGQCHCGAVKFEVDAPDHLESHECNCSMCNLTGYIHLIVPKSKFTLLTDESALETYTFNTGVAKHFFCKTCGIKSFYIPRSNPDGISVNVRCIKPYPENLTITPFDGQNWEQHAHNLLHLSQPGQDQEQ